MEPRRLVLVRHAQAADGAVDVDRPLTGLGRQRAAAIGRWLVDAGLVPDRVLLSPARRARQTWAQAGAQLPGEPEPVVDERIYDNAVEALFTVLREVADDGPVLALVGHNPSLAELVAALDDGSGDPAVRERLDDGLPTGSVVVLGLGTGSYADLAPGSATLEQLTVPGT